jgi:hypothetical protein
MDWQYSVSAYICSYLQTEKFADDEDRIVAHVFAHFLYSRPHTGETSPRYKPVPDNRVHRRAKLLKIS